MKIQFFRNRAGRRLAWSSVGTGTPLVFAAWWVSHLERQADDPAVRRFFGALAEKFRVIRYDRLGVGLSDRGRRSFTFAGELADLSALIERVGEPRVHLFGSSFGGPLALAYAARHPRRVGKLILYGTYADGKVLAPRAVQEALIALVRASWGLGSSTLADLFNPAADTATRRRYVTLQNEAADAETAVRLLRLHYALDVGKLLKRVRAPTLVLHRRGDRAIRYENGRLLAAALTHATLVSLEGDAHMPWEGDAAAVLDATFSFLEGGEGSARAAGPELRRQGEVWGLRYGGKHALLRDCKGIADLEVLLARPGEEVHVLVLLGGAVDERDAARADPALDRAALASYRKRLSAIDVELAEAEENADAGRARRLSEEREALLARLAADVGLRGRARRLNDPVERARKTVTARIRDAVRRIGSVHAELGRHLEAAVVTGVRCAYRPSPDSG